MAACTNMTHWRTKSLQFILLWWSYVQEKQINTTESNKVNDLEWSLNTVWSQKLKEKINDQKEQFGWKNKNLSIVKENEFKKVYLNLC